MMPRKLWLTSICTRWSVCTLSYFVVLWFFGALWFFASGVARGEPQPESVSKGFSVEGFRDGASHWRRIRDPNRFIQPNADQLQHDPGHKREIAENILLFQRANGGWPKDYDMLAILTERQRESVIRTRSREDTSFDNHNVSPQVEYLARMYSETGDGVYREGAERGLDFIFQAQYPNGGFPQWFPANKGYHGHITFNDGAMIGCLRLLRDVAKAERHWAWIDPERKIRANDGVTRGIECILMCQIGVEGVLTGWCQQHDRTTFNAAPARTFELESICPGETTEIAEFLMGIENPSRRVIDAVEGAIEWLKKTELRGISVKKIQAPPVQFEKHTADYDVIVVPEENGAPIWARHYEIGTNRPIFASRDGVKRYDLSEVDQERRTGSKWYGEWPVELLRRKYPEWRKRIDTSRKQ